MPQATSDGELSGIPDAETYAGPPRAGKGTFIEPIQHLLQRLCYVVDFNTFAERRDPDSNNYDLAVLKHCRLVVSDESNRNLVLNGAKLKSVTGGNLIHCRLPYGKPFNYRPQFKLVLVSNWPVNGDVDDDALWSRLP